MTTEVFGFTKFKIRPSHKSNLLHWRRTWKTSLQSLTETYGCEFETILAVLTR